MRHRLALVLITFLALGLGFGVAADSASAITEKKFHHAVKIARAQRGDPYVYGAAGPNAFDCSGLFYYSYGRVGINMWRTADDMFTHARDIPKRQLQRGDFIGFESGGHYYHIGIFLRRFEGRVRMLSAPHTGTNVRQGPLWTRNWHAATMRPRHHRSSRIGADYVELPRVGMDTGTNSGLLPITL